jgi:pimeloyl-ACP methyl ester carboxylesterase
MPFVENDGVKIYFETIGKGPPLVLHSGWSGTIQNYHDNGYLESLGKEYQLILMDARGHGKSDKLYNPELYRFKFLVKDVTTILDELEIDKTNFMGYSFGGRVGLAIPKYAPDRFNSLIIGGAAAIELYSPEDTRRRESINALIRKGTEPLIDLMVKSGIPRTEATRRVKSTDWDAMAAINLNDEHQGFEDYLPLCMIPCLFFCGEEDSRFDAVRHTIEMMKNAVFVSQPGLNHGQSFRQSQTIIQEIQKFLAKHNR